MSQSSRPFAVVTGASSGIGYELARQFAYHGFDLLITSQQERIAEDQPYVFLWTLESLWAINRRVAGPQPVPYGAVETKWNVHEWYTTDGK